jgi:hypothetical protein
MRTDGATTTNIEFSDETLRENFLLRQQLAARDATIANLQNQLETLQREVRQLRRLPTGKISQIPLEYVTFLHGLLDHVVRSFLTPVDSRFFLPLQRHAGNHA